MSPEEAPGSCALTAIERDILSLHRQDDVPGWEIPARYFAFARTGDASGLAGVLDHNRLDLISLAAVTALVLEMVRDGAGICAVAARWPRAGPAFRVPREVPTTPRAAMRLRPKAKACSAWRPTTPRGPRR